MCHLNVLFCTFQNFTIFNSFFVKSFCVNKINVDFNVSLKQPQSIMYIFFILTSIYEL